MLWELLYLVAAFYSFLCSPYLCFRLYDKYTEDYPEGAFAYIMMCLFFGVTLIGAVWRIARVLDPRTLRGNWRS